MKNIAEHILDITQNSISANANTIEIKIHKSKENNTYHLIIIDNGRGMDKETLQNVIDPFYTSRTTRKVGMGIPLIKQNAEITGGSLTIQSKVGEGTMLQAEFILDSLDLVPDGDIAGSVVLLAVTNPTIEFKFEFANDRGNYVFDTQEIKKVLGDVPLTNNEVRNYLIDMIKENMAELQ